MCVQALGFGQRKTPKPFVAACDKFIYTEILREPEEEREARGDREPPPRAAAARTTILVRGRRRSVFETSDHKDRFW